MKRLLLAFGFTAALVLVTATGGNAAYADHDDYKRSRDHAHTDRGSVSIKFVHDSHGHDRHHARKHRYKKSHRGHDDHYRGRRHAKHHYRKHLAYDCWCGHSHGHHGRKHYQRRYYSYGHRSHCDTDPHFSFSYSW